MLSFKLCFASVLLLFLQGTTVQADEANPGACSKKTRVLKNRAGGTVTSPNYPNNYPKGKSCGYYFRAPKKFIVILTFHDFVLEESFDGFRTDFFRIHDGPKKSQITTYYEGHLNTSFTYVSKTNKVRTRFFSDWIVTYRGFNLTYEFVDTRIYCDVSKHASNDTTLGVCAEARHGYATECDATCTISTPKTGDNSSGVSQCVDGRFESACSLEEQCFGKEMIGCNVSMEAMAAYFKSLDHGEKGRNATELVKSNKALLLRNPLGRSMGITCYDFFCHKPNGNYLFECKLYTTAHNFWQCFICRFMTECKSEIPPDTWKAVNLYE